MGFVSFVGRLLFASVFILSAWQEFSDYGDDGGSVAKSLKPKVDAFTNHVTSGVGIQFPELEDHHMKHLVAAAIAVKSIGGLFFLLGSSIGAYLLLLHRVIVTPLLYDFYNHFEDSEKAGQLFVEFIQSLSLLGALLFFVGMKNSRPNRQLKKHAPKPKPY